VARQQARKAVVSTGLFAPRSDALGPSESMVGTHLARVGWSECTSPREPHMKTAQHTLTVAETDELILAACRPEHGAIEDCEVELHEVSYFFETGAVGTVNRITGQVTIRPSAPHL
jgi:hypothetical protein